LTLAILLLTGCGVPGEPLPPLLEIPQPISDLSVEQVGAVLRLRWTPPRLTTEGTEALELERLDLYSVYLPRIEELTNFDERANLEATITAVPGSDGFVSERDIPVPENRFGDRGYFGIKAVNRRGKDAGFSNIASAVVVNLPEPPAQPTATVTEQAIILTWQEADRSVFGGPARKPDGYEIFRSNAGSSEPAEVIGTSVTPSFEDRAFSFGTRYAYFVRAFARGGESRAVTPDSPRIEVDALDHFAPAAPENLRAIAVSGAVELAWSPGSESDLAGYNIYRGDGDNFRQVNSALVSLPLYRDTDVRKDVALRYVVRAVDHAGNESASSEEATATIE
jgi:hypothetical protein